MDPSTQWRRQPGRGVGFDHGQALPMCEAHKSFPAPRGLRGEIMKWLIIRIEKRTWQFVRQKVMRCELLFSRPPGPMCASQAMRALGA